MRNIIDQSIKEAIEYDAKWKKGTLRSHCENYGVNEDVMYKHFSDKYDGYRKFKAMHAHIKPVKTKRKTPTNIVAVEVNEPRFPDVPTILASGFVAAAILGMLEFASNHLM